MNFRMPGRLPKGLRDGVDERRRGRVSLRVAGVCLCTAAVLFSAGCGNKYSSLSQVLATDSQKEAMLPQRLDRFNKSIYWGGLHEAADFVAPEAREAFFKAGQQQNREEKLVDLEVERVEFLDDSNTALVDLRTRYFEKFGTNYVLSRRERQIWKYHRMSSGWMFHGREDLVSEEGAVRSRPNLGGSMGGF
ncbi:MAG: hypothetical protein KDD69_12070 [Bdellovibrionales bacterium]|nr:hypothetical protein [Bdellovibrionales bacterium]